MPVIKKRGQGLGRVVDFTGFQAMPAPTVESNFLHPLGTTNCGSSFVCNPMSIGKHHLDLAKKWLQGVPRRKLYRVVSTMYRKQCILKRYIPRPSHRTSQLYPPIKTWKIPILGRAATPTLPRGWSWENPLSGRSGW